MSLGCFIDIGTPEDFAAAENFLAATKERRFVILDRGRHDHRSTRVSFRAGAGNVVPGVGAALRQLQRMGFGLVVITNQSGIGRGFFDQLQLDRVHECLKQLLDREGVQLDGLYVCPHKPDDDCDCRKPKVGLLQQAVRDLGFRLENSIVIGDKESDIAMGSGVGALTLRVRTGYGNCAPAATADFVVDDLAAATELIRSLVEKSRFEYS
jgi:D-glycero-D-manno-heptose 1,7-bisphosphate phosphatase